MIKKILNLLFAFIFLTFTNGLLAQVKTPKKTIVKKTIELKPIFKYQSAVTKRIKLITEFGDAIIGLYDSTPLHRDNIIKRVEEKFYDSLIFHRVISGFMVQGGDPDSKFAVQGQMLGAGGGQFERIPNEIKPYLIHKKGTLAAARDNNPQKASSSCQFYLVHGNLYPIAQLTQQTGGRYNAEQLKAYSTEGGTPMLDLNYTVYGEIETGIEIIDKIAAVQKGPNDRPITDIRMRMELTTDYIAPKVPKKKTIIPAVKKAVKPMIKKKK